MPLCIIPAASLLEQVNAAASLGTQKVNLHRGAALVGHNSQASPVFTLWVIPNCFQVLLTKYSMFQTSQGSVDALLRLSTIWTKLELSCATESCAYILSPASLCFGIWPTFLFMTLPIFHSNFIPPPLWESFAKYFIGRGALECGAKCKIASGISLHLQPGFGK